VNRQRGEFVLVLHALPRAERPTRCRLTPNVACCGAAA
jgi:hypothetical protein